MSLARLPDIPWVFIHGEGGIGLLRIDRSTAGDAVVDEEGRWTTPIVSTPVRGYVAFVSEEEQQWANSQGVTVHAVVQLPRTTEVDESDAVTVRGVDRFLDGTYRISAVHPTPLTVRCLLSRMSDEPVNA